jgi:hypothetical protein
MKAEQHEARKIRDYQQLKMGHSVYIQKCLKSSPSGLEVGDQ